MGKDPNRISPKGKKADDGWGWAIWIILAFLAAAGAGGGVAANNRNDPCGTGCKPVPHSTISPEGVKPLPKEK